MQKHLKILKVGYQFGAKGIGLVRTEHMFFGAERLVEMRRFILSSSREDRLEALNHIKQYQVEDFKEIFKLSGEHPTIVRLLDRHCMSSYHSEEDIANVAKQLNISKETLDKRIVDLNEVNQCLDIVVVV